MECVQPLYRAPVGIYVSVESQLLAQQLGHVVIRTGYGYTVIGTVTCHDGHRGGAPYHFFKGVQVQASQFSFSPAYSGTVQPAGRRTVCYKVLGHTGYVVFLISFDKGFAHAGYEIGVFTVGFFYPSPPQFPGNVEYRR